MDKSTLSNYGWIVIAVLVLAVMIALATPFGKYIEQGVRSTTKGLNQTSQNAINTAFESFDVKVEEPEFEEGYNAPNGGTTETPDEPEEVVAGATFTDGTFLTWEQLKDSANAATYGYDIAPIAGTDIGENGFYDCQTIVSIVIPDGVTSIGMYSFYGCSNLTSVVLPNTLTSIGESVFYSCYSVTSITIPASVTYIGPYVFDYCMLDVIFEQPNGWECDGRTFTAEELANPTDAGSLLLSNAGFPWVRSIS